MSKTSQRETNFEDAPKFPSIRRNKALNKRRAINNQEKSLKVKHFLEGQIIRSSTHFNYVD